MGGSWRLEGQKGEAKGRYPLTGPLVPHVHETSVCNCTLFSSGNDTAAMNMRAWDWTSLLARHPSATSSTRGMAGISSAWGVGEVKGSQQIPFKVTQRRQTKAKASTLQ